MNAYIFLRKEHLASHAQVYAITASNLLYVTSENSETPGVTVINSRNYTGKVIADMKIIFGQQVEMKQFESLYQALYRNGLGNLSVEPIWDNSKSSTQF